MSETSGAGQRLLQIPLPKYQMHPEVPTKLYPPQLEFFFLISQENAISQFHVDFTETNVFL